ncbi:MAG: primosomal protein N' [Oscillospiraceae bacterium]|nr:primosomal protein N' [Oscillospiraceae bacterium]
MGPTIAKIAVSAAVYAIDKPYKYTIPDNLVGHVVPGMRVFVPFGSGNRKSEGVVLSLAPADELKKLKSIDSLLDEEPIFRAEDMRLALWMSDRFFCSVYEALRAMLPAGMWFKDDGARRCGDKTENAVSLQVGNEEAAALALQKTKGAPKQAAVLSLLAKEGSMAVRELCFFADTTPATVKALEKQGLLKLDKREVLRKPHVDVSGISEPIQLSDEQREAYENIVPLLESEKPEAALLYGVTGSGKTLIYIKLIERAIALSKTAIVLVPEIALTPQTVSIFTSYFGESVAVLHSALGIGERYDEWKRVSNGAVRVVVGTRSAIFAPLRNIGLIVIDEEQEHTYKSENSPRYHARDIAKYRVAHSGALLLLSSATPSVESMYSAKSGRYKLFRLKKRYNERELPPVIIADMKVELKNGNTSSIGSVLRQELDKNIINEEQSILFINRRGTNPLVTCGECGYTFKCRCCSVSMTYHSSTQRLLCHYCGLALPVPTVCQDCGGKLKFVGAGTQKVESELLELFPGISVIRMDADTVARVNSHNKLLSRFRCGKAQILLGTQMVTKGLDFENVTLVGVLSADMSLYMSDYRAYEKTFSLITQVVGRSGRGEKPGRAVIQTFTPDNDVIMLASNQDFDGFYEREMVFRRALGSPPVNDLMTLAASGVDESATLLACLKMRKALEGYFRDISGIKLLGPAPAPVPKLKNKYRYRLLVSCENTKKVRDTIAHTVRQTLKDKQCRGVSVFADAYLYD